MEREDMRRKFKSLGLGYSHIDSRKIGELKRLINIELEKYNPQLAPNFIKLKRNKNKDFEYSEVGTLKRFSLRVKGSWFDDREAITFNRDGFIGFAGWADSKNVQPFLKAFDTWLETFTVLT